MVQYSSGKDVKCALFFAADSLSQALCALHCPFVIKSVTHTFGTRILILPSYRSKVKYANYHVCSKCLNAHLLHPFYPVCISCDLERFGTAGNPRMHFTLASQRKMLWCKVLCTEVYTCVLCIAKIASFFPCLSLGGGVKCHEDQGSCTKTNWSEVQIN